MVESLAEQVSKEATKEVSARSRTAKKAGKSKAKRSSSGATLTKTKLKEFLDGIGGILVIVNRYDGQVFISNSEKLAEELYSLAQENPSVKRALESLITTSVWAGMIGVSATILIPILANHGALPRETALFVGAELPPERPEKPKKPKREKRRRGEQKTPQDIQPIIGEDALKDYAQEQGEAEIRNLFTEPPTEDVTPTYPTRENGATVATGNDDTSPNG